MSDVQLIHETLAVTAKRKRWHRAWNSICSGFLPASAIGVASLLAYKLLPISNLWVGIGSAVAFGYLVFLFFRGFWKNPSLIETARWVDQKQRLQERVSTALEVTKDQAKAGAWGEVLVRDAAAVIKSVDP